MLLLCTENRAFVQICDAALHSAAIPTRWQRDPERPHALLLDVPASHVELAVQVLAQQHVEDLERISAETPLLRAPPLPLQPAFAVGVGLAALTLVSFLLMQGGAWSRMGAWLPEAVLAGQWWRMVTAATLHADWPHAASNAGFLWVVGWAAAERLGSGVTLLVWLLTAVAGFGASFWSDAQMSVGASGGLFGLLGAAAAHAVKTGRDRRAQGVRRLRGLLGALCLLALLAVSERANVHAHFGGFVAGIVLGTLLPRSALAPWVQGSLAVATTVTVLVAWQYARLA